MDRNQDGDFDCDFNAPQFFDFGALQNGDGEEINNEEDGSGNESGNYFGNILTHPVLLITF